MSDAVNHPPHYNQFPIEVIELTELMDFCLGNATKYVLRAEFKNNRDEDLNKAIWYLNRAARAGMVLTDKARSKIIEFVVECDKDLQSYQWHFLINLLTGRHWYTAQSLERFINEG